MLMADPTEDQTPDRNQRDKARVGTPSVVVDNVSVTFRIPVKTRKSGTRSLFSRKEVRVTDAVKDVSFSVSHGDIVGIIGTNGSGKSTLMRAIAGLETPTAGKVYATSTPALLNIGASLKKNLSGSKNIILGCLAMGLTVSEAKELQPKIIEFSGLAKSIDNPMRTYSSGMSARLRFAITTSVQRDILIIDEALAVGDAAFAKKSATRIQELKEAAGTVFLVSHSMTSILQSANRVLWMDNGVLLADGAPETVVEQYRDYLKK